MFIPAKKLFFFIIAFFSVLFVFPDEINSEQPPDSIISLSIFPGMTTPVAGDDSLYENGYFVSAFLDYRLPLFPFISFGAGTEYNYIPIKARISMSTFGGGGGVAANFDITDRLLLRLNTLAGYSYSMINSGVSKGEGSGGFYYTAGGDLTFRISQEWSAGLGSSYVNHGNLYQGARVNAIASYFINLDSTHAVAVEEYEFYEVFPALFNYHNCVPLGIAVIRNTEKYNAKDLSHELIIKGYMDSIVKTEGLKLLKYNESDKINFNPVFNEKIKYAASDKVPAEISMKAYVRYKYNEWLYRETIKQKLIVYSINSIKWNDPMKVSVFITPDDPLVRHAVETTAWAVEGKTSIPVTSSVLKALALYVTLKENSVEYTEDSNTPYIRHFTSPYPVDLLKYPSETFSSKSGESDELSLLFCSMLEASGIRTAVVALPEACFAAFALEDGEVMSHEDSMIKHEGKIWVPVDLRNAESSFDESIRNAVSAWNRYRDNSGIIFSLETARSKYLEPSFPPENTVPVLAGSELIVEAYLGEIKKYAYWEIEPEEKMLMETQKRTGYDPAVTNRLGVLYARFEKYEEAYREFELAAGKGYAPSMVNLANLYFLDDKLEEALPLYENAYRKNAYNAAMLQNMAVAYYKRLDFGLAREIYRKLEFLDPELGAEVSFMAERDNRMIQRAEEGRTLGLAGVDIVNDNILIERGNQYYLENRLKQAMVSYEKALADEPDNTAAIVSLARVHYEMDNYYTAGMYHSVLKEIDPALAGKNDYLVTLNAGAIMSAALENLKGEVRWVEE